MKKKLRFVLGLIGFILAGVFGYAAILPSEYRIARSIEIQATAEKVFPFLNEPKLMDQWMPWAEEDPAVVMAYEGPVSGVGARSLWKSTGKMGEGSATIRESLINQKVVIDLVYLKPFEMNQEAQYNVEAAGASTKVTWSVQGKNNWIGRVFCVFVNMDKMVGTSFEKGLQKLKLKAEASR